MIPLSAGLDLMSRFGLRPHRNAPASLPRSALSSAMGLYARIARLTELQARAADLRQYHAPPASACVAGQAALPTEEDVIATLAGGEGLRVVFQPQFDIQTQQVMGAEALIRWRHPQLGDISPSTLVPMVHRLGLDMLLFGFVKARTIDMLRQLYHAGAAVPIAINASAKTLCTPDLAGLLGSRMQRAGLSPHLLKVELTEDVKATDSARLVASLGAIQAQGFKVSLDDFGSGWSIPSLLSLMLFDEMKIDASYVQTMDISSASRDFIKEVLELSREFDFAVVAEGIQSQTTAQRLAELGCRYGQGFALARPLEADVFMKKLIVDKSHSRKRGNEGGYQ